MSCYVVHADLKLAILLPQLLFSRDYRSPSTPFAGFMDLNEDFVVDLSVLKKRHKYDTVDIL
jgi:hypothetical protein